MGQRHREKTVPVDTLRWRADAATFPFETTDDIEPLKDIIGQKRGVEAFRFGMGIRKEGYNVIVTGTAGTGRLATVKKLLEEIAYTDGHVPDDLCYVNNFTKTESPILLSFPAGQGHEFRDDVHHVIESLKKEVPTIFESQDYLNRKKEITEEYEKKGKNFFKELDKKVREEGFALVDVQIGQFQRPDIAPLIDGKPTAMDQVEQMVEKGRFPRDEFEKLLKKYERLKDDVNQITFDVRDLQKEIQENIEKMDRLTFSRVAEDLFRPVREKFECEKVHAYLDNMIADMTENMKIFFPQQQTIQGIPIAVQQGDSFQPYQINLFVDNKDLKNPPVIVESFPNYRNLFGSIERVVDRSGVWRSDFSKIKAGSFIRANGGYLVLNLVDVLMEPGVWSSLKRALKTKKMEIQTYDPFYLFVTSGMKPEPIDMNIKVTIVADERLFHLLHFYDEDVKKIFKVQADFDTSMEKTDENIQKLSRFVKTKQVEDNLRPFHRTAIAALTEHAVRMAGRQEKISTQFPVITDLIREADYLAGENNDSVVTDEHIEKAIDARIYRANKIEERIQEMIDRGTLMIDVDGSRVGQVNGLAVYALGEFMFGKPTRITATTSMGRSGIINIERESDMSGNTHNKGVLILSGYLRKKYAQNKPLTMSASIAFEQSYSGVDGDSASSAELYALLSSLSGVPLRQDIAVTGSINQNGEIQAIGGVNQKIEGFFDCCRHLGMTGKQGVMIPAANIKDLMLRKDVVEAVQEGRFTIYAVKTVDEGIEILSDTEAGSQQENGAYPAGTINAFVDEKFQTLAEGLKKFGETEDDKGKNEGTKN